MTQYNAGDPKQVEERTRQEELYREQYMEDLKELLDIPAGRRFFKHFFIRAKLFHSSFTGNSWTNFNEGRRDLGLEFFADALEAAPDKVSNLIVIRKGANE